MRLRGEDEIPPRNPDSLPDSTDPSGPCPRCGRTSNFSVEGTSAVSFAGGVVAWGPAGAERLETQRVAILECLGCHERVVVIEDQYVGGERSADGRRGSGRVYYRGAWWWPPPGAADLDAAIPEDIADAYREGVRAISARAPRAAAVMFRRTLEAIVKTSGSESAGLAAHQKSLAAGLAVMADEGVLDRNLADWAKEIRTVGNVGGHFDPADDVEPEEAENLARLLREVLRYLYEIPARIRRTRGN